MSGPCRSKSVANHLQPERHVGFRAEITLIHDLRSTTSDDKTIADRFTHSRGVGGNTEMHSDGTVDGLA